MTQPPRMFISYSWSTPEYEDQVLQLATELRGAGVDVILDKWDLKEGHDAISFMERMVTDPEVGKVAILCDRVYAEKADGRSGGVGAESQIISPNIYQSTEQTKFVAVVMERSEIGTAFLPAYYKSRIYIDLSDPATYSESYEKLLRWIFDKPLNIKPDIGAQPAFLDPATAIDLGASISARRAIDGLRNFKPYSAGALEEYFDQFIDHLERFRLESGFDDDALIENIDSFLPARNEFIQVATAIAQYGSLPDYGDKLHRFFERLVPFLSAPESLSSWREADYDNFKIIAHELFLYALAIAISHRRADLIRSLFDGYFVARNAAYGREPLAGYQIFRQHSEWLDQRNKRLGLNKLSLHALILKERTAGSGIDFNALMQADFLAYMRGELIEDEHFRWWPVTLVYAERFHGAFEFFARGASSRHLPIVLDALGVNDLSKIDALLQQFKDQKRRVPQWQFETFSPSTLLGRQYLGTRP